MEEFPKSNKDAFYELPFWPNEVQNNSGDGGVIRDAEEASTNSSITPDTNANTEDNTFMSLIMAIMPNIERRGYFGPCKEKPLKELQEGRREPQQIEQYLKLYAMKMEIVFLHTI